MSFKILFYSVVATESGILSFNSFGEGKLFDWTEIIEVKRPRFGIPYDFTYVISTDNEKMLLVRSMQNYKELIELIKAKAPKPKRL